MWLPASGRNQGDIRGKSEKAKEDKPKGEKPKGGKKK